MTCVHLPVPHLRALRALAKAQDVPRTVVIREAVDRYTSAPSAPADAEAGALSIICTYFEPEQWERLGRLATKYKTTRAALVREAVRRIL